MERVITSFFKQEGDGIYLVLAIPVWDINGRRKKGYE